MNPLLIMEMRRKQNYFLPHLVFISAVHCARTSLFGTRAHERRNSRSSAIRVSTRQAFNPWRVFCGHRPCVARTATAHFAEQRPTPRLAPGGARRRRPPPRQHGRAQLERNKLRAARGREGNRQGAGYLPAAASGAAASFV